LHAPRSTPSTRIAATFSALWPRSLRSTSTLSVYVTPAKTDALPVADGDDEVVVPAE